MLASARSWPEFTAGVATLNDTEKGTAFEHLVAHYLRTDPIYRAKLVHVWLLTDVPPYLSGSPSAISRCLLITAEAISRSCTPRIAPLGDSLVVKKSEILLRPTSSTTPPLS